MSSSSTSDVTGENSEEDTERSESPSPPGKKPRGRGRPPKGRGKSGRGRGRGRGRGQSGGTQQPISRSRGAIRVDEDTARKQEERIIALQRRIDDLTEGEAKSLLKKTSEKYPSLVFDLLASTDYEGRGYHPTPKPHSLSWCVCNRCREMPTEAERICCGRQPALCITQLPDFSVLILDEAVLALSRLYRQDILVLPDDENWVKANRHAAYRQFVLWQHGRLGTGRRVVIPSCCVWKIRDKFPDEFQNYTGFIPSRFV